MFRKRKEKKERKGLLKEFAEFINRGNIVDMAVGVIVGAAFKDIVNRLVDSIIMPILGLIIKTDLTELKTPVEQADGTVVEILWGTFIQAVLDFLIIAAVIFLAIKIFSMIRKGLAKAKEVVESAVDSVVDKVKGEVEEKATEEVVEEAQNEEK
ncbi:MAG: large conductance mechanosensitive channel protein MscL [Clostridia bacterium]|nr:large conductance mechanosensitive channel protein MscL [Clostridia bacterium]